MILVSRSADIPKTRTETFREWRGQTCTLEVLSPMPQQKSERSASQQEERVGRHGKSDVFHLSDLRVPVPGGHLVLRENL